jgi:hypothetical protein
MKYSTVLQNIKTTFFIFWSTQKWQILRNLRILESFIVHHLKNEIWHLYTAQNTEYFILNFCTHLESIIIYIPDFFLKLQIVSFKKFKKRAPWSLCSKLRLSPKMILHLMDHGISLGWLSLPNANDFILMFSVMPNCL